MTARQLMKQQWQQMALQNPFFGITSWAEFENPERVDLDYFWDIGATHARNLLARVPLGDTSQLSMVEIGCGMGRMTHFFATRFSRVWALDISGEMIRRAGEYWAELGNVSFVEGSGDDLQPIADADADFVLSFYVLNHVTDPQAVLSYVRETGRVLKPGGWALLHMRVRDFPKWSARLLPTRIRGVLRSPSAGFWWNRGIERSGADLTTDVATDFSRNTAWHGCEVPWERLMEVIESAGMTLRWIDIASAVDTHFAFLVLHKRGS